MPAIRTIKDVMFRMYCRTRNWWPVWYYLLNRQAKNIWHVEKPKARGSRTCALIDTLRRDGIAITDIASFIPDIPFVDLQRFAEISVGRPNIQEEIKRHQDMIAERIESGGRRKGSKKYLKDFIVEPYGSTTNQTIDDIRNPYIRMSLDERVLDIVGSYMDVAPKFRGFSLRITLPVPAGTTEYFSQRWHRDPEDRKMLKIFIYMTDVLDDTQGPFIYAKGSQPGGVRQHIFPSQAPAATYPEIGAVENVIPAESIITCFGKAGTIIFADTSGLHKGGYTISRPRLMYTGTFYSKASLAKYRLIVRQNISHLSSLARYALE